MFNWLSNPITPQWFIVGVTLLVGIAAFWIGWMQYQINNSTEIFAFAVPGNNSLFLRVTNVGKTQVYIESYEINGTTTNLHGALVPIQIQSAWYDIPVSPLTDTTSKKIILIITDELNRKWESEAELNFNNGWIATVYKINRIY